MKSLLKVFVLAGVMAFALAATEKDASAEPVLTSWYGPGLEGNLTANGEIFNKWDYTAAHPYLPFGTLLQVCYADCVTVRVNDRGPYMARSGSGSLAGFRPGYWSVRR